MLCLNRINNKLVKKTSLVKQFLGLSVGDFIKVVYLPVGFGDNVRELIGVCIGISNKGVDSRIKVLIKIDGVRVEFSFLVYSTRILELEILQRNKYKWRRAKNNK